MNFMRLMLLLAVSLSVGCVLLSCEVRTTYDHSADFQRYKTYSWMKVETGDPLWDARLQRAVDSELARKGWSKVPSDGNAMVTAFRKTRNEQSLETFYHEFGGGWGWSGFPDPGFTTTARVTTQVGNVLVDIFDGQTRKLLWRGADSADLSSDAKINIGRLQKDVHNMFKRFPPK